MYVSRNHVAIYHKYTIVAMQYSFDKLYAQYTYMYIIYISIHMYICTYIHMFLYAPVRTFTTAGCQFSRCVGNIRIVTG